MDGVAASAKVHALRVEELPHLLVTPARLLKEPDDNISRAEAVRLRLAAEGPDALVDLGRRDEQNALRGAELAKSHGSCRFRVSFKLIFMTVSLIAEKQG